MSVLFADVFEAIRAIRVCKGTTEKDIMNFVQDKVGGCLSVKNVLKTIRTLNKLVEEGLLVKKGKRYLFPSNPPNGKDPCEDEDDDSLIDEECDDERYDNEKSVCNKCPEDEEDEEEENEEDCEEEEDEDDDDCDDEEAIKRDDEELDEKEMENSLKGESSSNSSSLKNDDSYIKNTPSANDRAYESNSNVNSVYSNSNTKHSDSPKKLTKCMSRADNKAKKTGSTRRESNMKTSYRTGEVEQFARLFVAKNRGSKELRNSLSKRSRLTNSYRSRSPIRRAKADMYHVLNLDKSGIIGPNPVQSQEFEEAEDADMDVDAMNSEEYNLYRRPSTMVSPQAKHTKPVGEKSGSRSNNLDEKVMCETVKEEPLLEADLMLKCEPESKASIFKPKDPNPNTQSKKTSKNSKEKVQKGDLQETEKSCERGDFVSLCSVCEKKRKNS